MLKLYIKKNYIFILLSIAIFLGLILRLNGLTTQSYWFDEIFSIKISNPIHSIGYVYSHTMGDVHPPFYQSLLWLWYQIFGFNEYAGRVLSALAGTISIYAIYALARDMFNKEVGIYSAFITATNYFIILYSQEVRSNIFMFLFSILSYLYFIKLIKNYTKTNFSLYITFSLLLMYTHYFGFFLVATQVFVFIYYLIIEKEKRGELSKLAFASGLIISILLIPLIHRIIEHLGTSSYWMSAPNWLFFIDYMKAYVLSPFLHKIFLVLLIISIASIFIKNQYKKAIITLIIWVIFAYLLPYIKSITGFSIMIERNTIIVIPPLIILISYGIFLLRPYILKIILISSIIFFALYHLYRMEYYTKVSKDDFRGLITYLDDLKSEIPIYDFIMHNLHNNKYESHFFQVYANMLNKDVKIYPARVLKESKSIPKYFWAIHGHKNFLLNAKILHIEGMHQMKVIDKYHTQAILYYYNPNNSLKDKDE